MLRLTLPFSRQLFARCQLNQAAALIKLRRYQPAVSLLNAAFKLEAGAGAADARASRFGQPLRSAAVVNSCFRCVSAFLLIEPALLAKYYYRQAICLRDQPTFGTLCLPEAVRCLEKALALQSEGEQAGLGGSTAEARQLKWELALAKQELGAAERVKRKRAEAMLEGAGSPGREDVSEDIVS